MVTSVVKPAQTFQGFETSRGAQIYRIPMQAFPFLWVYGYLVLVDKMVVLIDTGSGFGDSNIHLEAGFDLTSQSLRRRIGIEDLTHILITHGHIDHFGGLPFLRDRANALLGIHELDLGVLTSYEERVAIAGTRLKEYLAEAGVAQDQKETILDMYQLNKALFHSLNVDFTYKAVSMRIGPFEILHVPGHCAGQVVIRLHDVLFSGDHVLGRITPHQSPERLTLSTGLGHYLDSLELVEHWAGKPSLTLAGHDDPIKDLPARISAIRQQHASRLLHTLGFLHKPHTIAEVSADLFGEVNGYDTLLAIEEAGAHVEYLHQLGLLRIIDADNLESPLGTKAVHYQTVNGPAIEKIRLI
jgi:glyoxylase-like metal-dependent hydrolase (beta-lactamase superfamily II)